MDKESKREMDMDMNEECHLDRSIGSTLRDSMKALFLLITARSEHRGVEQRGVVQRGVERGGERCEDRKR